MRRSLTILAGVAVLLAGGPLLAEEEEARQLLRAMDPVQTTYSPGQIPVTLGTPSPPTTETAPPQPETKPAAPKPPPPVPEIAERTWTPNVAEKHRKTASPPAKTQPAKRTMVWRPKAESPPPPAPKTPPPSSDTEVKVWRPG